MADNPTYDKLRDAIVRRWLDTPNDLPTTLLDAAMEAIVPVIEDMYEEAGTLEQLNRRVAYHAAPSNVGQIFYTRNPDD